MSIFYSFSLNSYYTFSLHVSPHFYAFPLVLPMGFFVFVFAVVLILLIACLSNVGSRDYFVWFLWVCIEKRFIIAYTWSAYSFCSSRARQEEIRLRNFSVSVFEFAKSTQTDTGTSHLSCQHSNHTVYPFSYCGPWIPPHASGNPKRSRLPC